MRLLDVETFEIVDFKGQDINNALKQCAIISHRWSKFEVDFQSFHTLFNNESQPYGPRQSANNKNDLLRNHQHDISTSDDFLEKRKVGIRKAAQACAAARANAYGGPMKYIWFDTCCIDKRNAQEYSHAIRSMFRWYQHANVCYAYLSDVSKLESEYHDDADPDRRLGSFQDSEWFKRGWTLQELLAPREVYFFDHKWRLMGTKSSLMDDIYEATGIDPQYLQGGISEACIAVKMSWMAERKTTYKEDMAYCMIGLFDIDMRVEYGEEERAFLRLQQELVRQIPTDESIFAWTLEGLDSYGLLAPWPSCFSESSEFTIRSKKFKKREGYGIVGQGIDFAVPNKLPDQSNGRKTADLSVLLRSNYKLKLNCWDTDADGKDTITIHLSKAQNGEWRRIDCDWLDLKRKPRSSSSFWGPKTSVLQIPQRVDGEPRWGDGGIHIFGDGLIKS